MPRTRRWSQVVHGFSAGILSPAAQDQIDSENWLAGAARLDNFDVQRDGGVAGRPAFVRNEGVVLPKPRYGLLAGMDWMADPGVGGSATIAGTGTTRGTIPANLYDTPLGIAPLGLLLTSVAADPSKNLFRVNLARGGPRAFVFHNVRQTAGTDPDRWAARVGGDLRLNFEVVGHRRGGSEITYRPAVPAAGTDEDPFANGQFVPGEISRDIVVRLDTDEANVEADLDWIALRYAHTSAAGSGTPSVLRIGGISCFSEVDPPVGTPAAAPLGPHVHDAPWRIIPWVIRDIPFVLVLGMDWVSMYQITDTGLERRQGDDSLTRGVWHFTERQLRELTWATFGGHLLLCHQDFPHPLEVRLPSGDEPFQIRPLALRDVPVLTADAIVRVAPEIEGETGAVSQIAPRPTRTPQQPPFITLLSGVRTLAVAWPDTGAAAYRVYWSTRAVYDANPTAWVPTSQQDVPAPRRSYTITGLVAGTEYTVAVASRVGTSESLRSPVQHARAAADQLAKPVVTLSRGTTDGAIVLDWPDVAGATRYLWDHRVAVSSGPVNPWAGGQEVTASTHTFLGTTTQTTGTEYEFRVQAQDASGVAGDSEWSDVVRRRAERLPAPTPAITAAAQGGGIRVHTTAAVPAAGGGTLQIQWKSGSETYGTSRQTNVTMASGGTEYIFGGIVGTRYSFRARVLRPNADPSGWSTEVSAVMPMITLTAPVLSQNAARNDPDTIREVWWTAAPGALSYEVQIRGLRSGQPASAIAAARWAIAEVRISLATPPVTRLRRTCPQATEAAPARLNPYQSDFDGPLTQIRVRATNVADDTDLIGRFSQAIAYPVGYAPGPWSNIIDVT